MASRFAYALRLAVPVFALLLAPPAAAQVPQPAAAKSQDSGRFILLEGGRNFRDVGGYRTADGRVVRGGRLYRSGSLGSLTLNDQLLLARLRVTSIIDLRTVEERGGDMSNWLPMSGLGYWTRDYSLSKGDLGAVFSDRSNLTGEKMRAMMAGAYRSFPREQAPSYREMFARLVRAGGAVVVNCTAGKDRTGIASALVLTALGVPYETVRADFLLSNGAPGMDSLAGAIASPLASLPPEVIAPLVGVEGEYLDTAFAQLRQDYGSVEAYMEKELGVGPREIAALRRNMLD